MNVQRRLADAERVIGVQHVDPPLPQREPPTNEDLAAILAAILEAGATVWIDGQPLSEDNLREISAALIEAGAVPPDADEDGVMRLLDGGPTAGT